MKQKNIQRFYRSVFVSDVHLLSKDSQAQVFYDFLDHVNCDYLYLVGDILDLWYTRKNLYWPTVYHRIFRKILKRAANGTQVIYLPGNHDELLRKMTEYKLGNIMVKEKTLHRCADGRTFLVIHGDQFDAVVTHHPWLSALGATAYDSLIQINRLVNWIRLKRGMGYKSISGAIKRRVKQAVKYVNNFETVLVKAAQKEEVHGVICGHIHQPAMKNLDGVLYVNSGDFVENCTAVVEDEQGRLEILHVVPFLRELEQEKRRLERESSPSDDSMEETPEEESLTARTEEPCFVSDDVSARPGNGAWRATSA